MTCRTRPTVPYAMPTCQEEPFVVHHPWKWHLSSFACRLIHSRCSLHGFWCIIISCNCWMHITLLTCVCFGFRVWRRGALWNRCHHGSHYNNRDAHEVDSTGKKITMSICLPMERCSNRHGLLLPGRCINGSGLTIGWCIPEIWDS